MTKSDTTKLELAQALDELLLTTTYDQITVLALTQHCGISRQAFYYHFANLNELAIWDVHHYIEESLKAPRSPEWQTHLVSILQAMYERKGLILKIAGTIERSALASLLKDELGVLAMRLIEDIAEPLGVAQVDRSLLARFYVAGTVEIIGAWVDDGMRERPERLAMRLEKIYAGGATGILKLFGSAPAGNA